MAFKYYICLSILLFNTVYSTAVSTGISDEGDEKPNSRIYCYPCIPKVCDQYCKNWGWNGGVCNMYGDECYCHNLPSATTTTTNYLPTDSDQPTTPTMKLNK